MSKSFIICVLIANVVFGSSCVDDHNAISTTTSGLVHTCPQYLDYIARLFPGEGCYSESNWFNIDLQNVCCVTCKITRLQTECVEVPNNLVTGPTIVTDVQATADLCEAACIANVDCVAASYMGTTCLQKGSYSDFTFIPGITSFLCVETFSPTELPTKGPTNSPSDEPFQQVDCSELPMEVTCRSQYCAWDSKTDTCLSQCERHDNTFAVGDQIDDSVVGISDDECEVVCLKDSNCIAYVNMGECMKFSNLMSYTTDDNYEGFLTGLCTTPGNPTLFPTLQPTPGPTPFPKLPCPTYTDQTLCRRAECSWVKQTKECVDSCERVDDLLLYGTITGEPFASDYEACEIACLENEQCLFFNLHGTDGNLQCFQWSDYNDAKDQVGAIAGFCVVTYIPTHMPSVGPTIAPSEGVIRFVGPSTQPTVSPTMPPSTSLPSSSPSNSPTLGPTFTMPSKSPSIAPSSSDPTASPSPSPSTESPSLAPTSDSPSLSPTFDSPSQSPTSSPETSIPSSSPTISYPTTSPVTSSPTTTPSFEPSSATSGSPSISIPSVSPTTSSPSLDPSSTDPSISPSSDSPSQSPSNPPSMSPTQEPSVNPSLNPTSDPTTIPSVSPSTNPTSHPSSEPSINPTYNPTTVPTIHPTMNPSLQPSFHPSFEPSLNPTSEPTRDPSQTPSLQPSTNPSANPSSMPTSNPSVNPSLNPTSNPSGNPSMDPTAEPSLFPTRFPTKVPSLPPSESPSRYPSTTTTGMPSATLFAEITMTAASVNSDFDAEGETEAMRLDIANRYGMDQQHVKSSHSYMTHLIIAVTSGFEDLVIADAVAITLDSLVVGSIDIRDTTLRRRLDASFDVTVYSPSNDFTISADEFQSELAFNLPGATSTIDVSDEVGYHATFIVDSSQSSVSSSDVMSALETTYANEYQFALIENSAIPTQFPTTGAPTDVPTLSPTDVPTLSPTEASAVTTGGGGGDSSFQIILGAVCGTIVLCFCAAYFWYFWKHDQEEVLKKVDDYLKFIPSINDEPDSEITIDLADDTSVPPEKEEDLRAYVGGSSIPVHVQPEIHPNTVTGTPEHRGTILEPFGTPLRKIVQADGNIREKLRKKMDYIEEQALEEERNQALASIQDEMESEVSDIESMGAPVLDDPEHFEHMDALHEGKIVQHREPDVHPSRGKRQPEMNPSGMQQFFDDNVNP